MISVISLFDSNKIPCCCNFDLIFFFLYFLSIFLTPFAAEFTENFSPVLVLVNSTLKGMVTSGAILKCASTVMSRVALNFYH